MFKRNHLCADFLRVCQPLIQEKYMNTNLKRRMLMGIGKFMVPIPRVIASKGLEKGASGARAKADLLSPEPL